MKLSIVIPAYNEEKYLDKCLNAIFQELKKTAREIEVIVVNNASTDRTKAVALSYPKTIVVDEPRKGLTYARQAGYLASSGDLIANLDADTILPQDWIKKVFSEFSKNPKLVALSGPYIYYDVSKLTNFWVMLYYRFGWIIHLINQFFSIGAMLQGGNFVVRKTALEKIGGYNTKIDFYGEDTDLARRIQKQGKVVFTFQLPMYTSGRRLKKEGLVKMGLRYGINFFWITFWKKPFTEKSIDIRQEG